MGCQDRNIATINHYLIRSQWERKVRYHFDRSEAAISSEEWPKLSIVRHISRGTHYRSHRHIGAGDSSHSVIRNSTMIDSYNRQNNASTSHIITLAGKPLEDIIETVRNHCLFVSIFRLPEIQTLNEYFIVNNLCSHYGCGYIPHIKELSAQFQHLLSMNHSSAEAEKLLLDYGDNICLPLSFNPKGPPKRLKFLTILVNLPLPVYLSEGTVVKTKFAKDVYLYTNHSLRAFYSGEVYLNMGFTWDVITPISQYLFKRIPLHEPIMKPIPNYKIPKKTGSKL
jgi:hypothetical protein